VLAPRATKALLLDELEVIAEAHPARGCRVQARARAPRWRATWSAHISSWTAMRGMPCGRCMRSPGARTRRSAVVRPPR
jgi:hypothetical protein